MCAELQDTNNTFFTNNATCREAHTSLARRLLINNLHGPTRGTNPASGCSHYSALELARASSTAPKAPQQPNDAGAVDMMPCQPKYNLENSRVDLIVYSTNHHLCTQSQCVNLALPVKNTAMGRLAALIFNSQQYIQAS
jgi:hypothetical protein